MVNMENYEEYMLLYADRELKPAEEKALLDFVAQHPELEAELKAYAATRLVPDTGMVFENKESLLKTAEPTRRIGLGNWKMYAAAACVLLVAVLFITNKNKNEEEANTVAVEEKTTEEPVTKTVTEPIQEQVKDTTLNNITPGKKVHSTSPVNTIAVNTARKKKEIIKGIQAPVKEKVIDPQTVINTNINRDSVTRTIAQGQHKEKEKLTPQQNNEQPLVIDDQTLPARKPKRAANFIAGILGDKPEGVTALEEAVDEKLMAVREFRKEIKDTEVKLRLGKKELTIVRL